MAKQTITIIMDDSNNQLAIAHHVERRREDGDPDMIFMLIAELLASRTKNLVELVRDAITEGLEKSGVDPGELVKTVHIQREQP